MQLLIQSRDIICFYNEQWSHPSTTFGPNILQGLRDAFELEHGHPSALGVASTTTRERGVLSKFLSIVLDIR